MKFYLISIKIFLIAYEAIRFFVILTYTKNAKLEIKKIHFGLIFIFPVKKTQRILKNRNKDSKSTYERIRKRTLKKFKVFLFKTKKIIIMKEIKKNSKKGFSFLIPL